jgi:hypothetical protein
LRSDIFFLECGWHADGYNARMKILFLHACCKRAGLPGREPKKGKKPKKDTAPQTEQVAPVPVPGRGEGLRMYDLWDTSAMLLLLADVAAKVVSEPLGHGSIPLTLDTYSHVPPSMQKRPADTRGELPGSQAQQRAR